MRITLSKKFKNNVTRIVLHINLFSLPITLLFIIVFGSEIRTGTIPIDRIIENYFLRSTLAYFFISIVFLLGKIVAGRVYIWNMSFKEKYGHNDISFFEHMIILCNPFTLPGLMIFGAILTLVIPLLVLFTSIKSTWRAI